MAVCQARERHALGMNWPPPPAGSEVVTGGAAVARGGAKKTIRQLREERGWSQLDVAVRVRASATAVYKWERGRAVPRPQYQQRLAALFGISVEELALEPAEQAPARGDPPG